MGWETFTSSGARKTSVNGSANYAARATRTTVQSIATSTWTSISFTSEEFDLGGIHSTVSNQSRLTAPVSGVYQINANAVWEMNTIGDRLGRILKNGSTTIANSGSTTAITYFPSSNISTEVYLTAGEYIEFQVFQDSGSNVDITTNSAHSSQADPSFSMALADTATVGSSDGFATNLTSPVTGDVVVYNSSTSTWENFNPPRVKSVRVTAQSITNTTPTAIQFTGDYFDSDTMHDNVTNNTRLTAPIGGVYTATLQTEWVGSAAGNYRISWITGNSAGTIATYTQLPHATGYYTRVNISGVLEMIAGDYVEANVQQDSGGALNLAAGATFSLVYLGP